jgi:hypothetical protein
VIGCWALNGNPGHGRFFGFPDAFDLRHCGGVLRHFQVGEDHAKADAKAAAALFHLQSGVTGRGEILPAVRAKAGLIAQIQPGEVPPVNFNRRHVCG